MGIALTRMRNDFNISKATIVSQQEKDSLPAHSFHYLIHNEVLLSTANVLIQEPSGSYTECRAVLDSGSEISFISRACASRLNLKARSTSLTIEGVAASNVGTVHHVTRINVRSSYDPGFRCEAQAYLVPAVTSDLPALSFTVSKQIWPHLSLLVLADPEYNVSRGVDLLLGADCFPFIMRSEVRLGPPGLPMAHSTVFGWVLLGPVTLKVHLFHPSELGGQEGESKGDEKPGESSSGSPSIELFDLRKHSHPGPCWLKEFSLF